MCLHKILFATFLLAEILFSEGLFSLFGKRWGPCLRNLFPRILAFFRDGFTRPCSLKISVLRGTSETFSRLSSNMDSPRLPLFCFVIFPNYFRFDACKSYFQTKYIKDQAWRDIFLRTCGNLKLFQCSSYWIDESQLPLESVLRTIGGSQLRLQNPITLSSLRFQHTIVSPHNGPSL